MSGTLAPPPVFRSWDNNGNPLVGGQLYSYIAGTSTPQATYTDSTLGTPNTNPIILNSRGEANVWLNPFLTYKFVLLDSQGNPIWTVDNIPGNGLVLTQQLIGSILYPETQAEIAASVTITQIWYPPGDVRRYGADPTNTTDSTSAISNAVAQSQQITGVGAYFPGGTYLTSSSISGFHAAFKYGPGVISRSGNTFAIEATPTSNQNLYVSTAGVDTNDGLSSSQPFLTLGAVFTALTYYGPMLNGFWKVIGAAGTYAPAQFPYGLWAAQRVIIQGPIVNHPNVPTMLIDGSGGASYGLDFVAANNVALSNIKIQNTVNFGAVWSDFCNVSCINVHTQNVVSGPGLKVQTGRFYMAGGIHTANQTGVEAIGNVTLSFGIGNTMLSQGTQIINCTQNGFLIQEQSSGDIFYSTITGCPVGASILVHSRIHGAGCSFSGSATADIQTEASSDWYNDVLAPCTLASANPQILLSFGLEVNRSGKFTSELRMFGDFGFVTLTGSTGSTLLKTYAASGVVAPAGLNQTLITADVFTTNYHRLRMPAAGELTGTAGTKTLTFNLSAGAVASVVIPSAATGSYEAEWTLYGVSTSQQSYKATVRTSAGVITATGPLAYSLQTGSDITGTIYGQLGDAADSITVRQVEAFQMGY